MSCGRDRTVSLGMAMFFTGWCWGSVSDRYSKGTVLYIGLCVCVRVFVWATHGHMHTWRSTTSQQSRFPLLVSAHKASPWQLRQKISQHGNRASVFLFSLSPSLLMLVFLIWFCGVTKINFSTIIISNDNNLYSINYLYCTIISPCIHLQQRGSFSKVKLSTVHFLPCPQFNRTSAERTKSGRQ